MVIADFYVRSLTVVPLKNYAPLVVDPNGKVAYQLARKCF